MPRIAYVLSDSGIPVNGHAGSSVHVRSLVKALKGLGADVRVVAARRGGEAPLEVEEARGGPVAALLGQAKGAARELGKLLQAGDAVRKLERLQREAAFDRSSPSGAAT